MNSTRSLLLCLALPILGCSSESESNPNNDITDAATDLAIDVFEATVDIGHKDTASDIYAEEVKPVACAEGSWGTIPNTQCNLIEQDCEDPRLTCYPSLFGTSPGTSCTFIGYGAKTRGAICDSNTECATGLTCLAGNCTPFCCKEFQYEICGPGGQCNIQFQVGGGHHVFICGYSDPCTIWAQDCPEGEACHPVGSDGSASCSPPSSESFMGEGEYCTARNDCGDSQGCVSRSGGPSRCRYYCKLGNSPYDAGTPNAAPGLGGCPKDQVCGTLKDAPEWLGVCQPED